MVDPDTGDVQPELLLWDSTSAAGEGVQVLGRYRHVSQGPHLMKVAVLQNLLNPTPLESCRLWAAVGTWRRGRRV